MNEVDPQRLTALIEGAAAVTATADLADLLQATVETARDTTGAKYVALGVIGEHNTLIEFVHLGMEPEVVEAIGRLPMGRGVLGTLIRHPETIRLESLSAHPDSTGFPPHHPGMETFLGVPVRAGERVFGNLYLTEKPGGFTAEDAQLVEALAAIAGSAISSVRVHERLRRLAIADDRERIARDLHDAIIQDLFAVGLLLQGLALRTDSERERSELEDAVGRLDQAITGLRKFIFDLRPAAWHDRDLEAELTHLVEQLAEPYRVHAKVIVDDGGTSVPGDAIDDVVQIVREAASNALRHSQASSLDVTVERSGGFLVVKVADQGQGFDPATAKVGMGLTNLRSRAERAGGETSILSRPGEGTLVRVVLPI